MSDWRNDALSYSMYSWVANMFPTDHKAAVVGAALKLLEDVTEKRDWWSGGLRYAYRPYFGLSINADRTDRVVALRDAIAAMDAADAKTREDNRIKQLAQVEAEKIVAAKCRGSRGRRKK